MGAALRPVGGGLIKPGIESRFLLVGCFNARLSPVNCRKLISSVLEKVFLGLPAELLLQRGSCRHSGREIAADTRPNIYMPCGDNSPGLEKRRSSERSSQEDTVSGGPCDCCSRRRHERDTYARLVQDLRESRESGRLRRNTTKESRNF